MKIVLIIVAVLALAIGLLLLYASTVPSEFRISRSIRIQASPQKIYPLISDLRAFNQWNPFAQADPSMTLTYGERSAGVGGSYAWSSTGRAGQGSMEISDAVDAQSVTMQLHFTRPMEARNTVVFSLRPQGNTTEVSWTMTGTNALINKVMSILFNMDRMVGGEFEKGLASLKTMAERPGA